MMMMARRSHTQKPIPYGLFPQYGPKQLMEEIRRTAFFHVVGQITILNWLVGFLRQPVAIDPLLPVVGICWIFGHNIFAMITVPRQWQRALVTLEEMQREDLTLGKPEWG